MVVDLPAPAEQYQRSVVVKFERFRAGGVAFPSSYGI